LKLPLLFRKSYLIKMAKASKIQIQYRHWNRYLRKQEVSSVWCENARTNDGENPEITITKSEVWNSKCDVRSLKSEVWRYLSLSVQVTQDKEKAKGKNPNTMCVGHHYPLANANNVNKTWALLQTTGGRDEPNIVCIRIHNTEPKGKDT
jgi:hypothetical protein